MNSIAKVLPVMSAAATFQTNISIKKASVRAADTVSRASELAVVATINARGAVGKAARNATASIGTRAIAEAMLAGNYQPAVEAILMRGGFAYLNVRNRTEWIALEANLQFALDTLPQTVSKKGTLTGKAATAEDTLLFYRSLNAMANLIHQERADAKAAAATAIAA